jgi:hypothetical protein
MTTIAMERKRSFDQRKGIAKSWVPNKAELAVGIISGAYIIACLLKVTA